MADSPLAGAGRSSSTGSRRPAARLAAQAAACSTRRPISDVASYNALNQVISTLRPVAVDGTRHQIQPSYDRAGAVTAVTLDGDTFVGLSPTTPAANAR